MQRGEWGQQSSSQVAGSNPGVLKADEAELRQPPSVR